MSDITPLRFSSLVVTSLRCVRCSLEEQQQRLATMERRITSKPDWTVGRDALGRAVLEWRLANEAERPAWISDASTDDVLVALGAFELELEDESLKRVDAPGFDPYDRCLRLTPCRPK